MPDWPPVDYDYGPALEEKNLRVVEQISWKIEDEILDGKRKVYKIPGYPGYYKNSDDKFVDLRPEENKPSYNNLK